MLNVTSNQALNYGKGWDDLNTANATILGIQLEKIKEAGPQQQDNMDRITDMYMIQKETLIKEIVNNDEKMIRDGAVIINEELGEVVINHNKITQDHVTNEDVIMTHVMNGDDKSINSDTTHSMVDSAKDIDVQMSTCKTNMSIDPNNSRKKTKK